MKNTMVITFLLFLTTTQLLITGIDCRKPPEEIRPGRHEDVDRFDEVYAIVRNTFLLAAAPAVISFLLSVFRDPDLPLLLFSAIRKVMKKRLLGSLSSSGSGGSGGRNDNNDLR